MIVGTTIGAIAIFDSHSLTLLVYLKWYRNKVRNLLVMPRDVCPCICAEIPFSEQENFSTSSSVSETTTARASSTACEPDSIMLTSIGNGKDEYCVDTKSNEDRHKVFDATLTRKISYKSGEDAMKQPSEDIVSLTWWV